MAFYHVTSVEFGCCATHSVQVQLHSCNIAPILRYVEGVTQVIGKRPVTSPLIPGEPGLSDTCLLTTTSVNMIYSHSYPPPSLKPCRPLIICLILWEIFEKSLNEMLVVSMHIAMP